MGDPVQVHFAAGPSPAVLCSAPETDLCLRAAATQLYPSRTMAPLSVGTSCFVGMGSPLLLGAEEAQCVGTGGWAGIVALAAAEALGG